MKFFIIIFSFVLLISCDDKNEVTYEYILTLSSNAEDIFLNTGEARACFVDFTAIPEMTKKDAEALLKSSNINFKADNANFKFLDYTIVDNLLKFNVLCTENHTENIINSKIYITISNENFSLEVSGDVKQAGSDIRYEYNIESEISGLYTIPANGGIYKIPLKSKRLTYINDKLALDEPYSLKDIRYVSNCVNIAWGHFDRIYKHGATGDYIIELTAEGPYNIEGDYFWKVELKNEVSPIFILEILHTQTLGDEYYIGTKTNYETYLIEE